MKKQKLHRSIDTPWGSDFLFIERGYVALRTVDEIVGVMSVAERWHAPNDDECGWVPIRPAGYKPQPPVCHTCGFQYSYGDRCLYERCHCERKQAFLRFVLLTGLVIAVAGIIGVIYYLLH